MNKLKNTKTKCRKNYFTHSTNKTILPSDVFWTNCIYAFISDLKIDYEYRENDVLYQVSSNMKKKKQ
jgi:hypothetical protein